MEKSSPMAYPESSYVPAPSRPRLVARRVKVAESLKLNFKEG
jgi:hypothetical protein